MTRRRARGSKRGHLGHREKRSRWTLCAAVALAAAALPVVAASEPAVRADAAAVQPPNTWSPTAGAMSVSRAGQTATLLGNGDVLVTGGGTRTAELYDNSTGAFTPTGSMSVARTDATATLLPSGDVLVAGGVDGRGRQLAGAELYDPSTGAFKSTGSMHTARSGHTATLLPDGRVLVAGGGCNKGAGFCDSGSFLDNLSSAELYDPKSGTWSVTGSMHFEREYFTATLLDDGDVLVAGGFASCDDDFCSDNRQAEIYHPSTGAWSVTGSMHKAREQFSATLLANGEVLVAGGLNEGGFNGNSKTFSEAEVYDPVSGTWSQTGSMSEPRYGQAAALLPAADWVLVTGGTSDPTSEVYQPATGRWVPTGSMSTPRTDLTATVLSDGNVLAAGGTGTDGSAQATAEVYENSPGPLVSIRPRSLSFGGQQVGTTAPDQNVTVTNVGTAELHVSGVDISGNDPGDFLAQNTCGLVAPGLSCSLAVRFAPSGVDLRQATVGVADDAPGSPQGLAVSGYGRGPGSWTPTGSMQVGRDDSTATLLADGDVLVAGGENLDIGISLSDAELYHPATGGFGETGSLRVARAGAAGALLADGDVLVAGGLSNADTALSSAELYDTGTGTWKLTTPMKAAATRLTATVLADGDVLVTGFFDTPPELYDPPTSTWTDTGPLPVAGEDATATMLADGDVLVAGGATTAAALYDPATNHWSATGPLATVQQGPTATLLGNGDVLVAGGEDPQNFESLAASEVYDPSAATWSLTNGQMSVPRDGQAAVELPNGDALVVGGCIKTCDSDVNTATTEEFDTQGSFWFSVGSTTVARYDPMATVLGDDDVLVAGGSNYCCGQFFSSADLFTNTELSVRPTSGPVGRRFTVRGHGFYGNEPVAIFFDFSQTARVRTDAAGDFVAKLRVPQHPPGEYVVEADGQRSFGRAQTSFEITP
jgi:WD40 repeat protein